MRISLGCLVLAAALYRLGPCPTPDVTFQVAPGVPVPVVASPPAYPVHAPGGGAVIVEVEIEPSGDVRSARAIGERTPFDGAAEHAARAWQFLPRGRQSRPLPTVAYLVLGFPEPAPIAGPE